MSSIAENQSNSLRNYVLGILVVVYTFNFIDRQILSILLESIKNDLNLSDTSNSYRCYSKKHFWITQN